MLGPARNSPFEDAAGDTPLATRDVDAAPTDSDSITEAALGEAFTRASDFGGVRKPTAVDGNTASLADPIGLPEVPDSEPADPKPDGGLKRKMVFGTTMLNTLDRNLSIFGVMVVMPSMIKENMAINKNCHESLPGSTSTHSSDISPSKRMKFKSSHHLQSMMFGFHERKAAPARSRGEANVRAEWQDSHGGPSGETFSGRLATAIAGLAWHVSVKANSRPVLSITM